jgi:hypothetical protein
MSKRKWCAVVLRKADENSLVSVSRCPNKVKPGTPFCKEHFETHKLIEVECNGEAHSNPYIDHCGVCMPYWGRYPMPVTKDTPGKPWTRDV